MYGINTNKELEIFNNLLMNKVKVSNKDYFQIIRNKKQAPKYSHIQYNHLSGVNYIAIDIDHDIFNTLEETNLKPNLVVANSSNNKGHCYFRLNDFVGTTPQSRIKPQKAVRLLTHSINNHLNGDKAFNGMQAKNPLHDGFRVLSLSNQGYDFDELFDNIPDDKIFIYKPEIVETKEAVEAPGRNCYLFELTRFYSYKQKWHCKSYDELFSSVEAFAQNANETLTEPLGMSEIRYIVKSISNFTWSKYTGGDGKNRGVLELSSKGHNLSLQDKQVIGAKYSHKIRTDNTEQRIVEAVEALQAENLKITQKAIAERSGLHRNTLRNHSELIKKLK